MMFWWIKLGYPDAFEPGKNQFFPRPGQVVKYYREKKMDDKGKAWSQKDLAKVLGITERSIGELENRDIGLDHERRHFLCRVLGIPPILLGIATEAEILQLVAQHEQVTPAISTPLYTGRKLTIDPAEYAQQLALYWQTQYATTAASAMTEMFFRLDALYRELPHARDGKEQIHILLCQYHQLISRILFDKHIHDEAVAHLDKALFFAESLTEELCALTLKRRGWIRQPRYAGDIEKAVGDFTQAMSYKNLPFNLTCSLLLEAGNIAAQDAKDDTGKQDAALALIDRAGNMLRSAPVEEDPHFLKVQVNDYHYHKAEALIAAGRNKDALEELHLVKGAYTPRGEISIALLEAQAYFNRGQYPDAANFTQYALDIALSINSDLYTARVRHVFLQLQQSSFRNNPDVARLDFMLTNSPNKQTKASQ